MKDRFESHGSKKDQLEASPPATSNSQSLDPFAAYEASPPEKPHLQSPAAEEKGKTRRKSAVVQSDSAGQASVPDSKSLEALLAELNDLTGLRRVKA